MSKSFTSNLNNYRFDTWGKVLSQPKEKTYIEVTENSNLATKTAFIWLVTSIILGAIGHFSFFIMFSEKNFSEYPPTISFIKFFLQVLAQAFYLVLSRLMVVTLVQHLVSRVFGGSGKYSKLFLITSSFLSPIMIIFAWVGEIPYLKLIALPLLLFEFYLHTLALKSVNRFSWAKAIGISIITIFVLVIFLIATFIVSIFTGTSIIINSPFLNTPIP
jgi:hypothetical protein